MDDSSEPTLPTLPSLPQSNTYTRPTRPTLNTRKRTHSSYRASLNSDDILPESAASSDPALFSGDDEGSAAAENYLPDLKRKKKMYSGSWWSHRVKSSREERKRELKRNVDSGVWMNEDESLGGEMPSSDSLGSLEEVFLRDWEEQEERKRREGKKEVGGLRLKWRRSLQEMGTEVEQSVTKAPPLMQQVKKIVQRHLDNGDENVELSRMDLTDLPVELAELATLTTLPNLVPGMLDTGRSFETDLKLNLSSNLFRRLPAAVLDLSNLKVLSLRQNKLKTLPTAIRRLTSLVSLSIGGNQLTHLPFEVLELAQNHKLKLLYAQPNPWTSCPEDVHNLAATETRPAIARQRSRPPHRTPARTTSLTETILRQLYRLATREELSSYMPADTPSRVYDALNDLKAAQDDGGRQCTRCRRLVVSTAHEWLEWWPIGHPTTELVIATEKLDEASFIPFKKMVCNAECAGDVNTWADRIVVETVDEDNDAA